MSDDTACDVLIVEDSLIQSEELASFLGRAGLVVRTALDAWSALKMAPELKPKVVLLDYDLGASNGIALAAELRPLLPDCSMVMMSGRINGVSERQLSELGITAFVNKPLPPRVLRDAVLRLTRASASRPADPGQRSWLSAGFGGTR